MKTETADFQGRIQDLPQRPQHIVALEQANRVRLARAKLKRKVAAGDVAASEVLLMCPWEAETMTVADLLGSQRRWGHTRVRRLLVQIPISETKTVGTLTDRQRKAIAAVLQHTPNQKLAVAA